MSRNTRKNDRQQMFSRGQGMLQKKHPENFKGLHSTHILTDATTANISTTSPKKIDM